MARRTTTPYLTLPNYTRMLRRYGLSDDDLAGEGSDRFVDTAVVWGDADTVRRGVDAHLDAGADHVAVQVLSADPHPHLPVDEWRRAGQDPHGLTSPPCRPEPGLLGERTPGSTTEGQRVGQVRKFCAERLGVGPRWPW